MSIHCSTCCCSHLWEMASYHLLRVAEVFFGTLLAAGAVIGWLILTGTNL